MNCNTTHYRANSSSVPGDPTEECRYLRLVNEIVEPERLEARVEEVARSIATAPFGVSQVIKRMVNWATRDQQRLVMQDREYDVDTASWDAAGVVPSDWMHGAVRARRAALSEGIAAAKKGTANNG